MAKLAETSIDKKNLHQVLENYSKNFLGSEASLQDFEELEAGVSYNYKLKIGDSWFMLKVDNPEAEHSLRNQLKEGYYEQGQAALLPEERFNLIAKFLEKKIAKGLQAPSFLKIQEPQASGENSDKFCFVAKSDEIAPTEFHDRVVSMQKFIEVEKPVSSRETLSNQQLSMLGHEMGMLHRPYPEANKFPIPKKSSGSYFFDQNRESVERVFGNTQEERVARVGEVVGKIDTLKSRLEAQDLEHFNQFFPYSRSEAISLISALLERACRNSVVHDLDIKQISHNDLHAGNMIRNGDESLSIIDLDEAGISSAGHDLYMILENIDVFKRIPEARRSKEEQKELMSGSLTKKLQPIIEVEQEKIENLLTSYLVHNPYMTRSEFQKVVDSHLE